MILVAKKWRPSELFLSALLVPMNASFYVLALMITGRIRLTGSIWWQLLIVSLIVAFFVGCLMLLWRVMRGQR